ncbi:hypothetical protein PUN28_012855 [Cardiocondyla obscurior]|uniref:Uncharacterized protein n=1 Tax=Cardiocondyla obscurior TaxID=286306 RepID=A0AAW2FAL5_9HYME
MSRFASTLLLNCINFFSFERIPTRRDNLHFDNQYLATLCYRNKSSLVTFMRGNAISLGGIVLIQICHSEINAFHYFYKTIESQNIYIYKQK